MVLGGEVFDEGRVRGVPTGPGHPHPELPQELGRRRPPQGPEGLHVELPQEQVPEEARGPCQGPRLLRIQGRRPCRALPHQVTLRTVTTVSWNACWPEIGSAAMGSTLFWAQPLPRFLTQRSGSPPERSSHHMFRSQSGSR